MNHAHADGCEMPAFRCPTAASLALGTSMFGTKSGRGWSLDKATARAVFETFVEDGGSIIDTADIYHQGEAETWTGEFVRSSGVPRDAYFLSTKGGWLTAGSSLTETLMRAIDESLRRLGTEYVDIYWLHRWNGRQSCEEVIAAVSGLLDSKKTRSVGISNFPVWLSAQLLSASTSLNQSSISGVQLQYSLIAREPEREYIPLSVANSVKLWACATLANGMLGRSKHHSDSEQRDGGRIVNAAVTDPRLIGNSRRVARIASEVQLWAEKLGLTSAQLALAWVLHQGVDVAIVGASRPTQLKELQQVPRIALPQEALAALDSASMLAPEVPYIYFK